MEFHSFSFSFHSRSLIKYVYILWDSQSFQSRLKNIKSIMLWNGKTKSIQTRSSRQFFFCLKQCVVAMRPLTFGLVIIKISHNLLHSRKRVNFEIMTILREELSISFPRDLRKLKIKRWVIKEREHFKKVFWVQAVC